MLQDLALNQGKFVVGIKEHPIFGYLPVPLIIEDCNGEFCRILGTIVWQDISGQSTRFSEIEREIIGLADFYSDKNIFKKFNSNKKISVTSFLSSLNERQKEIIKKYIDKFAKKILDIAVKHNFDIYLKPHRYENLYREDKVEIINYPAEAVFNFERNSHGTRYFLTVKVKDKIINLYGKKAFFIINQPCYVILDGKLLYFNDIDAKKIAPFINKEAITVPAHLETDYYAQFVKNVIKKYDVVQKGFTIFEHKPEKKALLYLDYSIDNKYILIPKFAYDGQEFNFKKKQEKFVRFDKQTFTFTYFWRDTEWENKIIEFLKNAGLETYTENSFIASNEKVADLQHRITINWLNTYSDQLQNKGIEVIQRFSEKKYYLDKVDFKIKVENKIDWFDIYASIKLGDMEIPFIELKDYILNGQREIILKDGRVLIIPEEWFAKYKKILFYGKKEADKVRLNKQHILALEEDVIKFFTLPEADKIKGFFNEVKKIPPLPKGLKASMRKYQLQGYAWLEALRKYGFGGCLADDMGLGKTLQTLAIILKAIEEAKEKNKQLNNLIIVPKSLLHNWFNEIKKFTPDLSVLIYAGNDRKKLYYKIPFYDIILTSYGIARNDYKDFAELQFYYLVLDESHFIKNPASKIYNAVTQLNSKLKIVLTGTPIENSLRDLWTQMNLINDNLLGSLRFFQEHYINPIEKLHDEKVIEDLKKIISPFLLRRKKEDVFDDLPDLVEQNIVCEMTDEQAKFYEIEKSKIRNKILEIYNQGNLRKSSIYILQAMTKLRQIANHPELVSDETFTSGKFDETFSRLEALISRGHKVLLFSSFVKFLNLYAKEFDKRQWKYRMLIGETQNREKVIDEFQNNDDIHLFLISLKVGGVGLNLTAADYVFLLDPWWNPAVEQQAIARTHRMGQTKNIFVLRFITYNSIEEKIQKLQEKKLSLSGELIDNRNIFAKIPEEQIIALFE